MTEFRSTVWMANFYMTFILIGLWVGLIIGCNVTKYEGEWLNQNGESLELSTMMCREYLKYLKYDLAGRHGPVDDIYMYEIMCSSECTEADSLHNAAIKYSGCDCLELSTQEGDLYYSDDRKGDFCLENTGRMLCEILEICENWDCDLNDFMCPRYNYNKKFITHRGYGDCSLATQAKVMSTSVMILSVFVTFQVGLH